MTSQRGLFDEPLPQHCLPLHAPDPRTLARKTDPASSHSAAAEHFASGAAKAQAEKILELLRIRPASSLELSKLALKYTSRISDLKKAGYHIECRKSKDFFTGKKLYVYVLIESDE